MLRRIASSAFPSTSATFPTAALFGFIRVALLFVDDEVAALLGREAAEVTFEGALLRMDPLVDFERSPAGAGVSALGTLDGLSGLVLSQVLPQSSLVGALEITVHTVEGVLSAMFDLNVRFQVAFHGAAVLTKVTLVRLFAGVNPDVPLQVRVDFEFGITLLALERCIALENEMKDNARRFSLQPTKQNRPTVADNSGSLTTYRCASGGAR